jgi:outer membrane receptor protein involved in Fe transport
MSDSVEKIVVIGNRPLTATSEVAVPAPDFELRPLESGGQLIDSVPGALTAQHTGGGKAEQYFLRGFDADHGTDLAVYFDGVPVNLRSHAHGQGFLDLHFITPETIARLDVAKGPYGTRYGDFATAATIEYVPLTRVDEPFVQLAGGAFDTFRVVGVASPRSVPFDNDDANALLSFEAYHTDGPFLNDEDLWRFSALARGDVRLSPSLVLSGHLLGYSADWNASGLVPERLVDAGLLDRFGSLDPTEGGRSARAQGKVQLDWEPNDRAHLSANLYIAYYDLDLYSNFTYALRDPVDGDGIAQFDKRLYMGGRIEYQHRFDLPVAASLITGLEWRYDDAQVTLATQSRRKIESYTSDDDISESSVGPYVEVEFLPAEWARFVGGLRFERLSLEVESRLPPAGGGTRDEHQWLPKANLTLSPFADTAPLASELALFRELDLFASFGVGFHSNDGRASITSDRILTSATGAELGLRTRLSRAVSASLSAFWLDLEDEFVFCGDCGSTEPSGRTRRLGLEFAAHAHLTNWLYLRGDVAYTSSRFTKSHEPVPQAPRFIAKGAVGIRHENFAAELGIRHLGKRYASEDFNQPKLSSYTVLDLGARYRYGDLELGIAVENLTNTRWRSSEFYYASCVPDEVGVISACPAGGGGSGVEDRHFAPGNPRNVQAWLRYSF